MIHFYIKHFLKTNKEVIVPGLGAFTLEETPSWYQEENQQFHPAVKKISFSESRRFEDNSFVADVARMSAYSEAEVQAKIQEFIYDLRHDITENGFFYVTDLGKLKIDSSYNLVFEQDEVSTADSFGLPDLEIPIIEREEEGTLSTIANDIITNNPEDNVEIVKEEDVVLSSSEIEVSDDNNPEIAIDIPADDIPDSIEKVPLALDVSQIEGQGEIVAEEVGRTNGPGYDEPSADFEQSTIEQEVVDEPVIKPTEESTLTEETTKIVTDTVAPKVELKTEEEEKTLSTPAIILFILIPICVGLSVYYYLNFYNQPSVKETQNTVADIPPIAPGSPEATDAIESEDAVTDKPTEIETDEKASSPPVAATPKVEEPKPVDVPKKEEPKAEEVQKPKVKEGSSVASEVEKSSLDNGIGKFKIIAGGFSSKENAQKLVSELSAKGYEPAILEPNSKSRLWQVALASFNSQAEAAAFLKKEQKNFKESLWIKK